jgi:hypothetical protein
MPVWAPNGGELYCFDLDETLIAVPTEPSPAWRIGTPAKLFVSRYYLPSNVAGHAFDIAPDGSRFLVIDEIGANDPRGTRSDIARNRLIVLQNWPEHLNRLVAGN